MLVYLMDGSATANVRGVTQIEVAAKTSYLTQSQHTGTGPTSPSTDPAYTAGHPAGWLLVHQCYVTGMTRDHSNTNVYVTGMTLKYQCYVTGVTLKYQCYVTGMTRGQ